MAIPLKAGLLPEIMESAVKMERNRGMSAVQELYNKLCDDIMRMAEERNRDLDQIVQNEHDWELRDLAVRVRSARFTLETADIERMRLCVRRDLAFAESANTILISTDVN